MYLFRLASLFFGVIQGIIIKLRRKNIITCLMMNPWQSLEDQRKVTVFILAKLVSKSKITETVT